MANVRLTLLKIREVLQLYFECDRNQREITDVVGSSTTTMWQYLRRARLAGLSWPLPTELPPFDPEQPGRLFLFRRFVECLPSTVHMGALQEHAGRR
jgi:hypothetical protein